MSTIYYHGTYECDGTSALKSHPSPQLSVYEGAEREPSRPRGGRRASGEPSRPADLLSQRDSLRATFLVVLCALSIMLAGFVADGLHVAATTSRISSMPTEAIRVYSGQTLWGIAEEHPVDGVSTRELVNWIERSNELSSASLTPGQTLFIPVVGK